jgi:hypothetical protein
MGLGIVSKRLTAPYRSSPSREWIKVIAPSNGRRTGLAADPQNAMPFTYPLERAISTVGASGHDALADGIAGAGMRQIDATPVAPTHSRASAKPNASISPLSTAQFLGFWIAVDLANL